MRRENKSKMRRQNLFFKKPLIVRLEFQVITFLFWKKKLQHTDKGQIREVTGP